MAIVCVVCLRALTVFIIFSLASLVGVSVCYAQSYVTLRGFSGFSWGIPSPPSFTSRLTVSRFVPHLHINYLSPCM